MGAHIRIENDHIDIHCPFSGDPASLSCGARSEHLVFEAASDGILWMAPAVRAMLESIGFEVIEEEDGPWTVHGEHEDLAISDNVEPCPIEIAMNWIDARCDGISLSVALGDGEWCYYGFVADADALSARKAHFA